MVTSEQVLLGMIKDKDFALKKRVGVVTKGFLVCFSLAQGASYYL